jgi:glucose/mannose-6-phosphate isomerase
MIDLDDRTGCSRLDPANMIDRIIALPDQIRAAWTGVEKVDFPSRYRDATQIVICGMGGSAIGGDLTRTLVEAEAKVPVVVVRGYDLPGFVGPNTLVVLSSFSGATEETLSAGAQALEAGALLVGITTGGPVADLARSNAFPLVKFGFAGTPREAIGYSTILMLGVLTRLGYVPSHGADVEGAASLLDEMAQGLRPEIPVAKNPAKQLALRLVGHVGLVYGGGLMAEVARRWKGQFNENAKNWAFFEQLPELNHNALLGYRFPVTAAQQTFVVLLHSDLNHPRISRRERATAELLAKANVALARVDARGTNPLEHQLSAAYVGDFVSYYLALLNGVDPSEMDDLNILKARMRQSDDADEARVS